MPDCEYGRYKEFHLAAQNMPQPCVSFLIPHCANGAVLSPEPIESLSLSTDAPEGMTGVVWTHGEPHRPWQAILGELCGLDYASDGQHLPAAALLCADETGPVICASPVHLQADRDSAILHPPCALALEAAESARLINDINEFVRQDGLRLSQVGSEWYLSAPKHGFAPAYPASFVAYRNATAYLSAGGEGAAWRRLISELQMLLFSHPVNQARERSGKLTVNSLWLWGGGSLPDPASTPTEPHMPPLTIHADDDYTRALAAHAGVHCLPVSAFDPMLAGRCIVIDKRLACAVDDVTEQRHIVSSINRDWLAPLRLRLQSEHPAMVRLYDERGSCGVLQAAGPREPEHPVRRLKAAATNTLQQISWRFRRRER